MTQYINKSAVVAEIKKRKKEAESNCGGYKSYDEHHCNACIVGFYEEFLKILDTLEVKEVQNIPVPDKIVAAVLFGANGYRNNVWHDRRETPEYKEEKNNQILVYGQNSAGRGCSVCSMIADGVIYSPMTHKEYKWGECHFTQWAYIEDLLPTEGYKE